MANTNYINNAPSYFKSVHGIRDIDANINGISEAQYLLYAVHLYNNIYFTMSSLLYQLESNGYGEIRNVFGFTYKLFKFHRYEGNMEYGFVQVEEDEPQNIVNVFTSRSELIEMLMEIGLDDIKCFNDPKYGYNKPWETIENTVLTQINSARYIADRNITSLTLS